MHSNVPLVVLTGGPGGGKTTALSYLCQELEDKGVRVCVVPEAATALHEAGLTRSRLGAEGYQQYILRRSYETEEMFVDAAARFSEPGPTVLICDRGLLDGLAYCAEPVFARLLTEARLPPVEVLLQRYAGVIHLVTAANGAEDFYTLENNRARHESKEDARAVDERLINAWTGCPHLVVLGNEVSFEVKLRRTLQAVCRFVGIPEPLEIEAKYLIEGVDRQRLEQVARVVEIEQFYTSFDGERFRRRGSLENAVYYHTIKEERGGLVRSEIEKRVTQAEYEWALKHHLDPITGPIQKHRHCFVWENQYFELDEFLSPKGIAGLLLLEVELTEANQTIRIPDFVTVKRDVSDDRQYRNYHLARLGD